MASNIDIDASYYKTGTATVAAEGTVVTGTGTQWISSTRAGDLFGTHVGDPVRILSVDSNTQLTLAYPWKGPAQTDAAYEIQFTPYDTGYYPAVRQLLQILTSGNVEAFADLAGAPDMIPMFTGAGTMELVSRVSLINGVRFDAYIETYAELSQYDDANTGFTVFVGDMGDGRSAIIVKKSPTTGDWYDPAYLTGPVGPAAPITVGTTTTTPPGTDATVINSGTPTAPILDFGIPAGKGFYNEGDYNTTTEYYEGAVVQYNGSSWISKTTNTNSPPPALPVTSNADWQLLAQMGSGGDMYKSTYDPTGQNKDIFAEIDTKFDIPSGTAAQYIKGDGTLGTAVTSVAGKTGAVTLTKGDVGLGNVDNTSDAAKPISTATQTALNLKANLTGANFTGDVLTTGSITARNVANVGGIGQGKVYFYNNGNAYVGEIGVSVNTGFGNSIGFYNNVSGNWNFNNNLIVSGSISKGSGTFRIDHPLDPFNKNLRHGFVEAPRYDLIYRGTVQLVNGRATVNIDAASNMTSGTFAALTTNAVVTSLQNQEGFARLKPGAINGGSFDIICEDETCTDLVSWVVIAERNDPFVKSDEEPNTDSDGRFVPEFEKEDV